MSNLTFSPVLFAAAALRESASIQVVFVTAAPTIIPSRNKKKNSPYQTCMHTTQPLC